MKNNFMRKCFQVGSIVLVVMMAIGGCGLIQDPVAYNNKIINIINNSQSDMDSMNNAMNAKDFEKAKEIGKNWVVTLNKNIEEMEAMDGFKGDDSFKNAVIGSLKMYKEVAEKDYPALIKEREGIANGSIKTQENEDKLLESINAKLENAGNAVNAASSEFEKKVSQ